MLWDPQAQVFSITLPIAQNRQRYSFADGYIIVYVWLGRAFEARSETYIHKGEYLVRRVVRRGAKQKGVDTVGVDNDKGYRGQRCLMAILGKK